MSNRTTSETIVIERSPIEETQVAETIAQAAIDAAEVKAPKKETKKASKKETAKKEPKKEPKKETIAKEDFETKLKSLITVEGYEIVRISDSGATIQHGDKTLSVRYRPYGYRINLKAKPNGRTLQATKKAKCVENTGKVAKTYP